MAEPTSTTPRRFRRMPRAEVAGVVVPVAGSPLARLAGLAGLSRAAAGPGLLIPRCRSVHTFGMRFALDVHFLDAGMAAVAVRRAVAPRRLVAHRGARAVLEVPAATVEG